jgi:ATP-dependent RNA helicase DDX23/PRP28
MNDRKFVFDWDETDDTAFSAAAQSLNLNGLAVAGQGGSQVMFGRGRLAGMDDGGGDIRREKGEKGGAMERTADPLERRRAAKAGMDERHWTEKALDEMKERDWRIFREDFSISARGKSTLILFGGSCC